MSQHDFLTFANSGISPKSWYQDIKTLPGFVKDTAQDTTIAELDILWHQLVDFKSKRNNFLGRNLLSPEIPKGLYLWGGVGRGKTFLMDAFYACLPYRRKRRIHFHNFMAEVHQEMKLLADTKDPLIALAEKIAQSTRLLCLDELHVDDIADAMILGRLTEAMLKRGIVLITTSNFPPDGLYPNGLQRQNFLPAITLLKHELKVVHLDGGNDYRLRTAPREPLFLVAEDAIGTADNEQRMTALFKLISSGTAKMEQYLEIRGRSIPVKMLAQTVVWFDFKELCGGAHAQDDYLEIAHQFPTVFLSHIPHMTAEHAAEARRLIWLIDVLYDSKVRLIASSASTPEEMFIEGWNAGGFSRTASRLAEMQTQAYLQLTHHSQNVTL